MNKQETRGRARIRGLSWVALGLSISYSVIWGIYIANGSSDFVVSRFGEDPTVPVEILILLQLTGVPVAAIAGARGGRNRVLGILAGAVLLLGPFAAIVITLLA